MQATGTYGRRGRLGQLETGIRLVSPTYGRSRIRTYSENCGEIIVDSQAERLVSQMLAIDPGVSSYRPQPFTIDLNAHRLLTTREQVKEVLDRYSQQLGPRLYTPDFCIHWHGARKTAIEVKTESYPGDTRDQKRWARAAAILAAYGYEFANVLVPDRMLGPLKQNVQLLQQAKRLQRSVLSPELAEQLSRLEGRALTLGKVCVHLALPLPLAPTLLLSGAVSLDLLHHPMHADTPVELAYGELEHLRLVERMW